MSKKPAVRPAAATATPAKPRTRHLRPTDLRAAARLAVDATHSVTRIAEGVHRAVLGSMGVPGGKTQGQTRGLTGFVYRTVHGVTALVGKSLEAAFTRLEPHLTAVVDAPPDTPGREAVLAALNGVMGDRLAAHNNPLATPMTLRLNGQPWDHPGQTPETTPATTPKQKSKPPALSSKVLLVIHGLCMNDLQWHTPPGSDGAPAVDLGLDLSKTLGYTPIYVRYNTGLHTSENGALLSQQLEHLAQHWPPGLVELRVLAHSMGGLVTRSAFHHAQTHDLQWQHKLKAIVFLGTPHHGAPLERAGNWVDVVLGSTPFSRPFARLGHLRSAGITDLRYGQVLATDWEGHDRVRRQPDRRTPCPLPPHVDCFTVAATAARQRSPLSERLLGDGLVPLDSALGHHPDPALQLPFAKNRQYIVYGTHHMQLLSDAAIGAQILHWLRPSGLQLRP